jgi:hypothetical protein
LITLLLPCAAGAQFSLEVTEFEEKVAVRLDIIAAPGR